MIYLLVSTFISLISGERILAMRLRLIYYSASGNISLINESIQVTSIDLIFLKQCQNIEQLANIAAEVSVKTAKNLLSLVLRFLRHHFGDKFLTRSFRKLCWTARWHSLKTNSVNHQHHPFSLPAEPKIITKWEANEFRCLYAMLDTENENCVSELFSKVICYPKYPKNIFVMASFIIEINVFQFFHIFFLRKMMEMFESW